MSSVKKNFGFQIAYRILTVVTPLITSPLLSRALGAEKLGIYSATQAYVNYFVLFAMLGIENYGNRFIAALRGDKKAIQSCFWNIYTVQFFSVCIAIIVYLISFIWIPEERKIISLLQGIWLISCLLDINWFFFGCEQFKLTVTRSSIVKIISVLCVLIFIRNQEDLLLYTIIMGGSMAISQLLLWVSLSRYIGFEIPQWRKVKGHIVPIFRLFIPVIGLSIFHIMDKTMLDLLSDEKNVGYYYSADKIINIPLGVISAVSTVMLPRMSYLVKNGTKKDVEQMITKSAELVSFLTASIGFGIASIAKEFVPIFFGSGFEPCITLIYFFVPVLFVKAWGEMIRSQYLIPERKDNLYTAAIFYGALANLIANYMLIKTYAALGAVLGTLIAETVVLIVEIIGVRKEINFIKIIFSETKYIFFGAVMLVSIQAMANRCYLNKMVQIVMMIVMGAFNFMVMCIAAWLIGKKGIFYETISKVIKKHKENAA